MPHPPRQGEPTTSHVITRGATLAALALGLLLTSADVAPATDANAHDHAAAARAPARAAVVDVFALTRDDPHGRRYRQAIERHVDAVIVPCEAFAGALGPPGRITDRAAEALAGAMEWLEDRGRAIYAASLIPTPADADANANADADASDFLARVLLTRGRVADWQLIDELGAADPPALGPRRVSLVAEHVRRLDPDVRLWAHDTLDSPQRLDRFIARLNALLAAGGAIDGLALTLADPALAAAALARLHERFELPIRIVALAGDAVDALDEVHRLLATDAAAGLTAVSLGPLWAGQRHGVATGPALLSETWRLTPAAAALGVDPPPADE